MGAVKGAISIKDNMSAVLRSIKQEQSAFRRDVQRDTPGTGVHLGSETHSQA